MSWMNFAVPVLICILILYVPGFLLLKAVRFPGTWCVAGAPSLSLLLYSFLGLAFFFSGLSTSSFALVGLAVALCAGVLVATAAARRRHVRGRLKSLGESNRLLAWGAVDGSTSLSFAMLLSYLAVGVILGGAIFIMAVQHPNAYIQSYDNVTHLAQLSYFAESNIYCPLGVTNYATMTPETAPFSTKSGFYPSTWHILGAMVANVSLSSTEVAANAVAFVTGCVVYPLSYSVFMMVIFRNKMEAIWLGSLTVLSFTAFPWAMLIRGPLYPNMLAFSVVPFLVLVLIAALSDCVPRCQRAACSAVFLLGLASLVFIQANGVFAVGLFSAPFIIWKVTSYSDRISFFQGRETVGKVVLGCTALTIILVTWVAVYNLPFLQSVVHYGWPSWLSKRQALVNVITVSLWKNSAAQLFMALLILLGLVSALLGRRYRPLAATYCVVCAMYFFSASSDGFLDSFLTGFWYSDQCRVAAMVAMGAVPLAALGASVVLRAIAACLRCAATEKSRKKIVACSLAILLGMWVSVFYPSHKIDGIAEVKTAFGTFVSRARSLYGVSDSQRHMSEREKAFVQKASQLVDEGFVLNNPFDGSVYSFLVSDLPVYYRTLRGYGTEMESEVSVVIREGISNVVENDDVKKALRKTGVRYVLLLDQDGGEEDNPGYHPGYRDGQWDALDSVSDETPGFNVILAEGDMRLYEIDPNLLAD